VLGIILTVLYVASCLVLIMFVLLQPSKSDASQVFGGGASSTAFGPRGTQSVLAKITITAAIVFFLIAFLFSIPGLFDKRSLGEGLGPQESPVTPPPLEQTLPSPPSATEPSNQPAAAPVKPAESGPAKSAKPAETKDKAKPGAEKKN
jgi:preprotein translocase subunit SecG